MDHTLPCHLLCSPWSGELIKRLADLELCTTRRTWAFHALLASHIPPFRHIETQAGHSLPPFLRARSPHPHSVLFGVDHAPILVVGARLACARCSLCNRRNIRLHDDLSFLSFSSYFVSFLFSFLSSSFTLIIHLFSAFSILSLFSFLLSSFNFLLHTIIHHLLDQSLHTQHSPPRSALVQTPLA